MDEDYDQVPSSTADDDLSLPKGKIFENNKIILLFYSFISFEFLATVTKMIQEMLPLGISCPRETRDLLLDCCVGKKKTLKRKFRRKL